MKKLKQMCPKCTCDCGAVIDKELRKALQELDDLRKSMPIKNPHEIIPFPDEK
jgi:hypothetical protein